MYSDEGPLFSRVYEDLRRLAAHLLSKENAGQTLQPTALVHEVYLRLFGYQAGEGQKWENRVHLYSAAAEAMRRILIEVARRKARDRRGGSCERLILVLDQIARPVPIEDFLALNEARSCLNP